MQLFFCLAWEHFVDVAKYYSSPFPDSVLGMLWHFFDSAFRLRKYFLRIWIPGIVSLNYGSGSGSGRPINNRSGSRYYMDIFAGIEQNMLCISNMYICTVNIKIYKILNLFCLKFLLIFGKKVWIRIFLPDTDPDSEHCF